MKELLSYDRTKTTDKTNANCSALPLLSWEFYGSHLMDNHQFGQESAKLQKITKRWNTDYGLRKKLVFEQNVVIITDVQLRIVYTSANIEKLNGYTPDEVVGNTPKLFQGADTCPRTSSRIRAAIDKAKPFEEKILNYKKNAEPYYCVIKGYPVFDKKGSLINYIAFETAA
ncbi:PAS domain-containing protein [Aquimarina brevivitae]|uniref:PAS domain S-box-containing protein n=1 Tax=Aquimarina brevivitae TaxID=323412 RepID=A0A4Q7P073_9FLAO|nr:PAS domain-containing protein [Aquimarina brevivitae]RZS93173.1 PAS domain S-box-containing protein [Aquimarina brevivitae]